MFKLLIFQVLTLSLGTAAQAADDVAQPSYFCSYAIRGDLTDAPSFPFVQERVKEFRELRMPDLKSDGDGAFTYLDGIDRIVYVYAREGRLTISISRNSDSFSYGSVEFKPTDSIRIEEAGDGRNFVSCTSTTK
ncbi:MAG: hypothetical protein AAB425_01915 [Bdellovibrionota bacterium]